MNNALIDSERLQHSRRRRSRVCVLVITTIASGLFFGCPPPPAALPPDCIKFEKNPWSIPPASASWSGCCYHKSDPSRTGVVAIETLPNGAKRARCNF